MKVKSLTVLVLLFASSTSFAREIYEFYNGSRQMAMGGASVAVVNDETALLLNPAALGRLRDFYLTIADPEVELNQNTEQIAGTDVLKMTDPQKALNKLNLNKDKHLHERAQVFPSIVAPNFGFGLFARYSVDAEVVEETNKYKYHYRRDYASVFGFSFRFFNGIIKLGANARIVDRAEILRDDIDPASTDLKIEDLVSEGAGVGSDAGLIITLPIAYLPTLAAVYRDVGDTTYDARDGMFINTTTEPPTYPTKTEGTLDAGLSISPILSNHVRMVWTVEYKDCLNDDELEAKDPMRRAHGGVELNLADAFFIRGGMNQKYWTAGIELSMFNYQFQATSYGEDIGSPEASREDRRYNVKFALRF